MALTNLSQITTSGIATLTDINLNNITGVAATFTGNVTVGGTLTYDDVTNIDSVGLITARSGIRVLTGTATTALVVEGDARITGILTVGSSSLTLDGTNNVVNVGTALTLGHTQGIQFHTQNLHSQGFEINNVNATGIVTATTFIGNLTGTASNASGATSDFSIADKIVHTGDTNTAIRFPTADTISAETSGVERLRITSGGDAKIGSGNPSFSAGGGLHVESGTQANIRVTETGNTGVEIQQRSGGSGILNVIDNANLLLQTNNIERLRITSAGRVGIGTNSPDFSSFGSNTGGLEISDVSTNNALLVQSGANEFYFANTSSANYIWGDDNVPLSIATNDIERLRITSAGQMILGTATNLGSVPPKFTIANNTNSSTFSECQLLRLNGPSGVGERGGIGFHYAQSLDYGEKPSSFIGVETVAAGGAQQTDLLFATRPNTNDTEPIERLRITSDGNIGIGLTNPTEFVYLKKSGDYKLHLQSADSDNVGVRLWSTRNYIIQTGPAVNDGIRIYDETPGSVGERLRITSAGNLLVNTATSRSVMDHVGNGPTPKIQIEATNSNAIMSIISAGTADANRCGTINLGRHRNGTVGATPTIVNDNDALGAVVFSGGDGGDMLTAAAKIHAEVDGTPGANDMPGALVFSTTPDGQGHANNTERLRIDSSGRILKGMTASLLGSSDFQLQGSGGPATIGGYWSNNNPAANSSMLTVTGYSQSGSTFTGIGAIDFRVDQGSNTASGYHPGSIVMRVNGGMTTGFHGGYSYSYAGLKDRERITFKSKRHYCLPEYQSGNEAYNTFREQWDYQHVVGYNQYSWYRFTTHSASGSRGGSVDIKITWSTRHAAGNGYGHYGFHWRDNHSTGYIEIGNVYKYHQHHLSGSFYGWTGSPQLDVYEVNDNGNVAGFYLRVQGHMSMNSGTYDGGVMHQFTINAHTNRYGADVNKFEFVGNSTPSDVGSIQGNINP